MQPERSCGSVGAADAPPALGQQTLCSPLNKNPKEGQVCVVDGVTIGPSAAIYIASFDMNAVPSGSVDAVDLGIFGSNYGSTTYPCGDYNCSGVTDAIDLAIFGTHYGHVLCP